MARAKLKLVNKGRTPEREALAEAIATLATAERGLHEHRAAAVRSRALVAEARDKLARAREGVERAKDDAVNLAMAGKPATARIRKARQAEADAEDALDVAEGLLSKWVEWEANISRYPSLVGEGERRAVDAAVWAVIRVSSAPARVLAEAVAATEEALRARAVVYQLYETRDPYDRDAPGPLGDIKAAALELLHRGSEFIDEHLASRHPGATMWKDAIEALRQDPDAPLPE
jgi:multidrug efflux pump subunit AcrA (membrane-fusion protein)